MLKILSILVGLIFITPAFANVTTYSCVYNSYSDQQGRHSLAGDAFELDFLVDQAGGKTYLISNNGSSEVSLYTGKGQMTFLEITRSADLTTTSIDSNLFSVHSRNPVVAGGLKPSQYYGACKVKSDQYR